jgi:hypothetical protein
MSTRCNVLLFSPEGAKVYFYRHTDGYLSQAGARLYHTYTAASVRSKDGFPWIGDFAERLLRAQTESGDALYRLTSGPHVDVEYFYALEFPGFQDDAMHAADRDDPMAYSRNKDLLKVRWARGYGRDLEKDALAKPPLTIEAFWRDIATNADRSE